MEVFSINRLPQSIYSKVFERKRIETYENALLSKKVMVQTNKDDHFLSILLSFDEHHEDIQILRRQYRAPTSIEDEEYHRLLVLIKRLVESCVKSGAVTNILPIDYPGDLLKFMLSLYRLRRGFDHRIRQVTF